MPDSIDQLHQRVRSLMPDLAIETFERNTEGLINDVVIVNRKLVFRFARTEEYARLLEVEQKILDLIRPRLAVRVPEPVLPGPVCMVYPLLDGQPLSNRTLLAFDENARRRLAEGVGTFLRQLHAAPAAAAGWEVPPTRAYVTRPDYLNLVQKVKQKIYPLFQNYQVEWAEDLFDRPLNDPQFFDYVPALIHGDLASYHILFDPVGPKVTAVIDFGMAGLGDPASDFGNLISIYGESFVQKMGVAYPGLEELLPRARFYAQTLELEWVLRGLESGETFWFTAHLGGARDIKA